MTTRKRRAVTPNQLVEITLYRRTMEVLFDVLMDEDQQPQDITDEAVRRSLQVLVLINKKSKYHFTLPITVSHLYRKREDK